MHTPDSSRYWIARSYDERFQNGLEPENVDKVHDIVPGFGYCYCHGVHKLRHCAVLLPNGG